MADRLGLHVVNVLGYARVRVPFHRGGQVVYHQDRALGSVEPKWLNPSGPIPCPYNADSMARAPIVGAAYVLEGVSDVIGLLHSFPDAVAIGAPGSGVFKAAWARAFAGLTVIVIGDNDAGGEHFRRRVGGSLLLPPLSDICTCPSRTMTSTLGDAPTSRRSLARSSSGPTPSTPRSP